jgi:hypothetical protein
MHVAFGEKQWHGVRSFVVQQPPVWLEGGCTCFGYCVILFTGASTDADCADDFTLFLERNAAGKDHNLAVVGGVDAEELVAGLGVGAEVLGGDVEGAGGPGFFLRDVDGAEPGVGHALEGDEVAALVDYGYVHGLLEFFSFFLGCGDDAAGVC